MDRGAIMSLQRGQYVVTSCGGPIAWRSRVLSSHGLVQGMLDDDVQYRCTVAWRIVSIEQHHAFRSEHWSLPLGVCPVFVSF